MYIATKLKPLTITLLFLILLLNSCFSPKLVETFGIENDINVYIETQKEIFSPNEKIDFSFVIENKSKQAIFASNNPVGTYVYGEKQGGFDVFLDSKNGRELNPILQQDVSIGPGRTGIEEISPGNKLKIKISPYHVVKIKNEGAYQLIIEKELTLFLEPRAKTKFYNYKDFKKKIVTNKRIEKDFIIAAGEE